MYKLSASLLFFLCFSAVLSAQSTENTGWIFLSHTQNVSKKWDVLFDAQVRSADKVKSVNTLLLRSALSYHFSKKHSAALGYAFKGDWEHEIGVIDYQPENRIYEQYLFQSKLHKTEFTARFRFEQRFVKEEADYLFSQRARAFLAFQIPVIANKDFSKGVYVNVQDEIFTNVYKKEHVNNSFFDQNRLLFSAGYRWSKKLDTELGYMFWRQNERDGYASANVYQLMITTEL